LWLAIDSQTPNYFQCWRTRCIRCELHCCRNPLLKVWMTFTSGWRIVLWAFWI